MKSRRGRESLRSGGGRVYGPSCVFYGNDPLPGSSSLGSLIPFFARPSAHATNKLHQYIDTLYSPPRPVNIVDDLLARYTIGFLYRSRGNGTARCLYEKHWGDVFFSFCLSYLITFLKGIGTGSLATLRRDWPSWQTWPACIYVYVCAPYSIVCGLQYIETMCTSNISSPLCWLDGVAGTCASWWAAPELIRIIYIYIYIHTLTRLRSYFAMIRWQFQMILIWPDGGEQDFCESLNMPSSSITSYIIDKQNEK